MLKEVSTTTNRGFIPGFYARNPKAEAQELALKHALQTHLYASRVVSYDKTNSVIELEVKNRLDKGDTLTFITPEKEFEITLNEMYYFGHPKSKELTTYTSKEIKPTEHAHPGDKNIYIEIPFGLKENWDMTIARMPYKEAISLKTKGKDLARNI